MEAVQKKVLSDIFLAPSITIPIVAGLACWGLSWAAGGIALLSTAGTIAVVGGFVWMVGRTFMQLDRITARAGNALQDQIRQNEEERIEKLLRSLRTDRDYRTKDYLTILRESRNEFENLANQPLVKSRSLALVEQVRQLFWSTISQLEQSYKLFEQSERIVGGQRSELITRREELIEEIGSSTEKLRVAVEQYKRIHGRENEADMNALRDELDTSLKIAARTEARMRELEGTSGVSSGIDRPIAE